MQIEQIVCKKVQYARLNGKIARSHPTVIREVMKVTPEYRDKINEMTEIHGVELIEDEVKTAEWREQVAQSLKEREANAIAKKAAASQVLAQALAGGVLHANQTAQKATVDASQAEKDAEIERLKAELAKAQQAPSEPEKVTVEFDSEEKGEATTETPKGRRKRS